MTAMSTPKTSRIGPGEYTVTDGVHTIWITRFDHLDGPQWVARAAWDRHIVTDPLWTLASAKTAAGFILEDAEHEAAQS